MKVEHRGSAFLSLLIFRERYRPGNGKLVIRVSLPKPPRPNRSRALVFSKPSGGRGDDV
jgi:hypothetical protein